MTRPPNILFIQADQLTASVLRMYGNRVAVTPHLEELADSSSVFSNAYANFPLCAPSRFSMLSGMLASRIGAYDNGAEFPSSVPTFVHYLRAAGYQTCLSGKMHFVGADQLHGFEQRLTTDIYPADFNWTGDWTEKTPEFANDARSFSGAGVCARNVQMDYDDEVCHRARQKLFDLARSDDDRPFLLLVSFTHPHDPYQCTTEHWGRYRHDDIDMPRVGNIADSENDPYSLRLRALSGLDHYQPDEDQIRTARHAYYGSLSYLDDLIGNLMRTLKTTGFDDNTTIIFTSDHGDMLGERGLWYKKCFFEDACKVPLLIRHGERLARNCVDPVSLVDLLPTLLDIGEVKVAPVDRLDGQSLYPFIQGSDAISQRPVMAENLAEGASAPAVMIRAGDVKFIHCQPDPPQLFDLRQDPDEMENIAGAAHLDEWYSQVADCWQLDELNDRIELSQQRRLFLRSVLSTGETASWDYQAPDQAEDNCLRSDNLYNDWAYSKVLGAAGALPDKPR